MTYVTPQPVDMATRLGLEVETARATAVIADAEMLAKDIVTPLPDSAAVVVLAAAIRAYTNITGVVAEQTGPTSVQRGPSGATGVFLTKYERLALKRAAGMGGAFNVDLIGDSDIGDSWWAQFPEDAISDLQGGGFVGGGFAGDPDWAMS